MFGPVKKPKKDTFLPRSCTFDLNDWKILSRFWHPIAYLNDLAEKPLQAKLLDVELVI